MQHLAQTPAPRPAQDPTPAQLAAWARLHGYAGTPLPAPVEAYLQAECRPHREAAQQAASAKHLDGFGRYTPPAQHPAQPATEAEELDLWPAIRRLYIGLGIVGAVAVAATFWSRFA